MSLDVSVIFQEEIIVEREFRGGIFFLKHLRPNDSVKISRQQGQRIKRNGKLDNELEPEMRTHLRFSRAIVTGWKDLKKEGKDLEFNESNLDFLSLHSTDFVNFIAEFHEQGMEIKEAEEEIKKN